MRLPRLGASESMPARQLPRGVSPLHSGDSLVRLGSFGAPPCDLALCPPRVALRPKLL